LKVESLKSKKLKIKNIKFSTAKIDLKTTLAAAHSVGQDAD